MFCSLLAKRSPAAHTKKERPDTRITQTEEKGEIARRTGELPGNTTRKGEFFATKRETPIPRKNARCCEVNQQEEPWTRSVTIWVMMSDQFQLISLGPLFFLTKQVEW